MTASYDMVFGVFEGGRCLWIINRVRCSHRQAEVLVAILDMGKGALEPGHYFACDYAENVAGIVAARG